VIKIAIKITLKIHPIHPAKNENAPTVSEVERFAHGKTSPLAIQMAPRNTSLRPRDERQKKFHKR
jgi:hypothetical protein